MKKKPTKSTDTPAEPNPPAAQVSAVMVEQLRTQADLYREQIGHEIVRVSEMLRELRENLEQLKTIARDAKSDVDDEQEEIKSYNGQLTQLALDMARIEDGTYEPRAKQQTLPFGAMTTVRTSTVAESAPLAELAKHGCPKGLLSALASSQLAAERKLETVGDLMACIQADDYWFKKIKGMGDERRDKLIDALTSWGAANPEPQAEDGRVKQCIDPDCLDHPTAGVYVNEACPVCGGAQYFQLIDPPSPA